MSAKEYLTNLQATRRKRLQELVDTFATQQEAATEIGYSSGTISSLLCGRRKFNEEAARAIEGNFGLVWGALDRGAA